MKRGKVFGLVLLSALIACRSDDAPGVATAADYVQEVSAWHEERTESLRSPTGWLALVGLHWLEEGSWRVGSGSDCDVRLPASSASLLGQLIVSSDEVRLHLAEGVEVTTEDGESVSGEVLLETDAGEATFLHHGSLSWHVIQRGDRRGLRVRDSESETRRSFRGIERFPVERRWRVLGKLVPHEGEPELTLVNVVGIESSVPSPGTVVFQLQGKQLSLTPVRYPDTDSLFFVFGDETNGEETYGGGRFLEAELPVDGKVLLDFNRATNPPCAFSSFATCPVPPEENLLPLGLRAGERKYGDR